MTVAEDAHPGWEAGAELGCVMGGTVSRVSLSI